MVETTPPPAEDVPSDWPEAAKTRFRHFQAKIRRLNGDDKNLRVRLRQAEAERDALAAAAVKPPPTEEIDDDVSEEDEPAEPAGPSVREQLALLLAERQIREPRKVLETLLPLALLNGEDLLLDGIPANDAIGHLVPPTLQPPRGMGGSGGSSPRPASARDLSASSAAVNNRLPKVLTSQAAYNKARAEEGAIALGQRIQRGDE